jgi:hypothetical protein
MEIKETPPKNPYYRPVEMLTLDEGMVVLQWPERLSKESLSDLRDWLSVLLRRAERRSISKGLSGKVGEVEG